VWSIKDGTGGRNTKKLWKGGKGGGGLSTITKEKNRHCRQRVPRGKKRSEKKGGRAPPKKSSRGNQNPMVSQLELTKHLRGEKIENGRGKSRFW